VRSGTLEIQSDASDSLEFISLIGSTTAAPLTLSPSGTLSFGNVNLGSMATLNLGVTNSSGAPVTFTGVTASVDYSVAAGTCPANGATLAAGATCSLIVTFTPTATGTRTGTLSLSSNATALPLTVSLTGIGTLVVPPTPSFTLTVNGASTATMTVKSGTAAVYPLLLTPVNGFTGPVALTCAPVVAAQYASCSLLGSTLTLNGSALSATATISTFTTMAMLLQSSGSLCALLLPLLALRRRKRSKLMRDAGSRYRVGLGCCVPADLNQPAAVGRHVLDTPAGTYQYQVTASSTSGTVSSSTVTLNLIVQ
jgi:hypothetical protein